VERPKSIRWLASGKSSPYTYTIAGTLVFILVVTSIYGSYQTRCKNRIRVTIIYLKAIRNGIQVYYKLNGRYPDSLSEFRQWVKGDKIDTAWSKMYVDLTSEKQSDIPEYREMNDKGGYYYDPNTGEIRLNLTRPVKEYLKWYEGKLRDQVPSSW